MIVWKNPKGFTLIEVLISITILAVMMVYIFNLLDSSTRMKETIVDEDREYLQVLTALERMAHDFSHIYSPLYFSIKKIDRNTKGLGIAGELFQNQENSKAYTPTRQFPEVSQENLPIPQIKNESPSEIIFFSKSYRRKVYDSPTSSFNWVSYRLRDLPPVKDSFEERNPERAQTKMITRASFANDPYRTEVDWESNQIKEHPLLKGVKDFEFSYWNEAIQDYVNLLRQNALNPLSPQLFRIKFTWISKTGDEFKFERTFRPLWPKFDRQKQKTELIKVMQETVKRRREAEKNKRENQNQGDNNNFQGGPQ
jgi:prepilin-type N-terminal cleavage/methylation domain-containing protein